MGFKVNVHEYEISFSEKKKTQILNYCSNLYFQLLIIYMESSNLGNFHSFDYH